MFEQMEESVDRCWAFNKAGQRCEMVAGHDRDHSVIIAWGPDECWTPIDPTPSPQPPAPQPRPEIIKPSVCVMCDHPDHRGKCGRKSGDGFECDCAEGIPA